MSAPNQPDNTLPNATAGSSAPAGGTPSAPTEWRVPETDHRPWARGKTAAELLSLTDQVVGAWQASQVQAPPAPQPQQPQYDPTAIRDDDFVDGRNLKGYMNQAAAPLVQSVQQLYESVAQQNLHAIRSKFPEAFERYGSEIDGLVNRMPAQARTLDNLTLTVELVMGRHWKDEAKRLASEMGTNIDPTLRSGGGSGSNMPNPGRTGSVVGSEELPADYRALLQAKGIDDRTLEEFFASQHMGPEDRKRWFESAKKHSSNVITERSARFA